MARTHLGQPRSVGGVIWFAAAVSCPESCPKLGRSDPAELDPVEVIAFVNGKRKRIRRGHALRSITLGRLPHKRFTVRIVTTLSSGTKRISTRTFHGCRKTTPKLHVHHPHH